MCCSSSVKAVEMGGPDSTILVYLCLLVGFILEQNNNKTKYKTKCANILTTECIVSGHLNFVILFHEIKIVFQNPSIISG